MKRQSCPAFTLVELLVVMGIIALLAGILLPVLSRVSTRARVTAAQFDAVRIAQAIQSYHTTCGGFPVSTNVLASFAGKKDFPFGANLRSGPLFTAGEPLTNDQVIAVLMDREHYINGGPTINLEHLLNLQRVSYLTGKPAVDDSSPGVGQDGVYRDPWRQPYLITLDMNFDDRCDDLMYPGRSGQVLVWSAGPDGSVSLDVPPNAAPNRDNILSGQ